MRPDLPFPHSLEHERALLGGLLVDATRLSSIGELVAGDDFHRPEHRALFELLVSMAGEGTPIDTITVPERVHAAGADRFGGVPYVLELVDRVTSTSNLEHYAAEIRRKAILRRFIAGGQALVDDAFVAGDVDLLLEGTTRLASSLTRSNAGRAWHFLASVIAERLAAVEDLATGLTTVTGTTSGFEDLDEQLAGFQHGDLVILAARPSMGKTALALNLAANAALVGKVSVAVFSLEMNRGQLADRMLCTQGLVDAGRMRRGTLEQTEWERLIAAQAVLASARIHIDDTPALSLRELGARARRLASDEGGLGLVVIDYLQLMQADERGVNRTEQVSEISRGLKALAKELQVPVIALSQLNRSVEQRADKRPLLSDLRESGAIEQDADVILFIYRDEYYNKESQDAGMAEVIIAKQRNGPIGTVKLVFRGQYGRFDEIEQNLDI
jgi:replicative DNA helicase